MYNLFKFLENARGSKKCPTPPILKYKKGGLSALSEKDRLDDIFFIQLRGVVRANPNKIEDLANLVTNAGRLLMLFANILATSPQFYSKNKISVYDRCVHYYNRFKPIALSHLFVTFTLIRNVISFLNINHTNNVKQVIRLLEFLLKQTNDVQQSDKEVYVLQSIFEDWNFYYDENLFRAVFDIYLKNFGWEGVDSFFEFKIKVQGSGGGILFQLLSALQKYYKYNIPNKLIKVAFPFPSSNIIAQAVSNKSEEEREEIFKDMLEYKQELEQTLTVNQKEIKTQIFSTNLKAIKKSPIR